MRLICVKRMSIGVMAAVIATTVAPLALAAEASPQPVTYEMSLVYIFESPQPEFILVIGNTGFRTVAALRKFLASLPAGTTLRWSPGCERFGGEPILSSDEEMARFKAFCRKHQINFVLVPSG